MASKTTDWRPGPTVCRCCLTEGCYKDISTEYFWMGKREVYAEMLSETFSLSIAYSQSGGPNSNSRLICEPCISRLRDASDFRRQVQECEKTFTQYLDPATTVVELDAPLVTADAQVKVERVKIKKEASDDDFDDRPDFNDADDDDDDDLDDQPLTKLASKVPKKESVDLMDLLDNAKAGEKRKSTTKTKTPAAKKAKGKKEAKATTSKAPKPEKKKKGIVQASDSSITIKDEDGDDITLTLLKTPISLDSLKWEHEETHKVVKERQIKSKRNAQKSKKNITEVSLLKEPISLDDWSKESLQNEVTYNVKTVQGSFACRRSRETKPLSRTWKSQALIIFENSFAYPFVYSGNKYKCFVCSKTFLDPHLLKEHSTTEHTSRDLQRVLSNRMKENNLKVDITHLQCKLCLDTIPDLNTLKSHLIGHGKDLDLNLKDNLIPFKLSGDTFECQICGEDFLKLRLLIIHMSKHFSNFSCEVCGSAFVSMNLLKCHQQIHVAGNFPCEKCDKVFSNAAKKSLHVRGVHLKKLPRRCPICPERFNSDYQRTRHLRTVHNQSTASYRCETCGREYDLKYHLLTHIRSVHLKERNEECHICHSRFFSKYHLSRHMMTHTGEKMFKSNKLKC